MPWNDPTAHVYSSGEALTAVTLNTYVEQNLAYLGAGYGAIIYLAASGQNIPNNTDTIVHFDTIENDPLGMATTGTSAKITIPAGAGGLYVIDGAALWAAASSGTFQAKVFRNGAELRAGQKLQLSSSVNPNAAVSTQRLLSAGDYVQLAVNQGSGAGVTINGGANITYLAVHLIAPR